MTEKLFDDFFKQKLENHDSGAPMHVWEKVRRELHEDDDDKGIIWWRNPIWLIAIFLLAGGITSTSIIGSKKGWFTKSVSQSENKPVISKDNAISVNANTETNNIIKNKEAATDITNNKQDLLVPQSSLNPAITTTDQTIAVNDKIKNLKNSISGNQYANKKQINISRSLKKNQLNQAESINDLVITPAATDKKNDNNTFLNALNLPLSEAASKKQLNSILTSQKIKSFSLRTLVPSIGCPTIGPPRRNDLYIEFYGAADNVNRSLSSTSSTPADYIDKRKEAEKKKIGFSAGVRIAKNLGEKFVLKTGFNYSQINEQLKYVNEKDIRTVTVITTRTVTSGGQTITISDTTTVTQIGTTYTTFHNRYRTIDIPLILSYELGNSRNFNIAINAGAIVNLQSIYTGKILDTSLQPVSINTYNTLGVNSWRKNIGLGLYASISLYKRINDKMQLFFEPYTRINLNPVTSNSTLVKQKYSTTGLQIGVRYNLFHKRQRYVE